MTSFLTSPKIAQLSAQEIGKLLEAPPQAAGRAPERRGEQRVLLSRPVMAQLLGDDLECIGTPVKMVVRDVSTSGVGLIHSGPISASYLILKSGDCFENDRLVHVLRCRELGAYYDLGGCFVTYRQLMQSTLDAWHETCQRTVQLMQWLDQQAAGERRDKGPLNPTCRQIESSPRG